MVGQEVKLPEGEKLWIPKCLCVVSHWPFHDVYKEFLKQLYRLSVSTSRIALERLICNFMQVRFMRLFVTHLVMVPDADAGV
jgi:hypothetical protein